VSRPTSRKGKAAVPPDSGVQQPSPVNRDALQLPSGVLPLLIPLHANTVLAELAEPTPQAHLHAQPPRGFWQDLKSFYGRHLLVVFALLFLLVGAVTVKVSSERWLHNTVKAQQAHLQAPVKPTISGLNKTIPAAGFDTQINAIINQPAVVSIGEQRITIPADTVKSWLQISISKDKSEYYVRVKSDAINTSLADIANNYVKAPVDQVVVDHGAGTEVITAGRNGVSLVSPQGLKDQAALAAKTLLDGKGLSFSAPVQTQAFATVTPAAFDKLIEVDVVTKQMYLYEKGNLAYSYPVSAGAPATPTPIGKFKIYAKYVSQDMRGLNTDGSPYFQPHVNWVNYFLPGGYAVHGVYWHGASWFGNINSSHGCVGIPDAQAKVVYNWAPIGTTVITHT
jgi:lipoprotein-anchoring transpeptidase ErfK/SrfK